jgi:hypothetical protein
MLFLPSDRGWRPSDVSPFSLASPTGRRHREVSEADSRSSGITHPRAGWVRAIGSEIIEHCDRHVSTPAAPVDAKAIPTLCDVNQRHSEMALRWGRDEHFPRLAQQTLDPLPSFSTWASPSGMSEARRAPDCESSAHRWALGS